MYKEKIKELQNQINDTYGSQIVNYDSGYICDVFSEIASSNIDIYDYDLFNWAKDHVYIIDESMREYGNVNDIIKQLQMAQGYSYEQELQENRNSILEYYTYNYLDNKNIKINDNDELDLEIFIKNLNSDSKLEEVNDYCDSINVEAEYEL